MNDINYEHHLDFKVVIYLIMGTLEKGVFLSSLFFASVSCAYIKLCSFHFLPLTPLCEPFNLAVLELAGKTGCEDTCCQDDCGTLKVP